MVDRRKFLKITAAGSLLGISSVFKSCAQKTKPNILYISMEDLSPLLGCYGHGIVKSPNIDAFARESVLLADCHCQVALCTPSRTSILTGIRPTTSGIVKIDDDWQEILPETVSLPRHFRDNGYFTSCVGKIYDPRCGGMDDAWDRLEEEWGVADNQKTVPALEEAAEQDKPFFLAIGYKQVHDPWTPSQESLSLYDLDEITPLGPGRKYDGKLITEKEVRELIRKYYAEITDVDRLIGEVLDAARELGLFENTIILVGAMDHGYSLGEHGHWGKGNNVDTETQVPLLISIPDNPENGKKAAGLTELVDIYPTLIELCNLPDPPQKLEGYSMRKLLLEPERNWKKAVFSVRAYHPQVRGVKTKLFTYIQSPDEEDKLFDRINDPQCSQNIAVDNSEIVGKMRKVLKQGWENAKP